MPPPFRAGAWSEDLADSYLALGRVDDAVRMISDTTCSGHAEGTEMPCEPAEKLMRSGYEPLTGQVSVAASSRRLPEDVRVHVQGGIGYGDIGDRAGALEWLTTGLEADIARRRTRSRPLSSSAHCAHPVRLRSGAHPRRSKSERPKGNTGER